MKNYIRIIALVLVGIAATGHECSAQDKDYRAHVLFLYNFIKYISWPTETDHFVIGVMGESPVAEELRKLAAIKKTPAGKPILIKIIDNIHTTVGCQIIYIPDAHSKDIAQLITIVHVEPALIVSERDGLTKKGADISFFTDDDKLGFPLTERISKAKN
jgi:hypothetical protein